MTRLPRLSGRELVRILSKFDFHKIRQKGSHVMLVKETKSGKIGCVVPLHDEIERGTLIGILKQAKISKEEFLKEIRK